jgi:uncharacterized membrane protein YhaH (DUF805 family)
MPSWLRIFAQTFDPRGRSLPTELFAAWCVFTIFAGVVTCALQAFHVRPDSPVVVGIKAISYLLTPLYVALFIRRLHDINLSGAWWLLSFIPIGAQKAIGAMMLSTAVPLPLALHLSTAALWLSIAVVIFGFAVFLWPGTKGNNRYGPSPLQKTAITPAAAA